MDKVKVNKQEMENTIALLKEAAWNSLFVFSKTVLGNNLMEENPHRELCEYLEKAVLSSWEIEVKFTPTVLTPEVRNLPENNKILLMLPRGSYKSTIASVALPIWLMWHNRNLRIMLDCATLVNAKMYISAIKDHIDNNDILKMICTDEKGVYLLEPDKQAAGGWTEDRILLKHRTKLGLKEPSMFVSAVDNNRTGMHPDVIIMDDLVSESTVTTPDQRNKTKTHYKFSLSLLERGGLQVVIGTRYHMDDLYAELLENTGFTSIVRPAILPSGKLYFPAKYTLKVLEELKRDQGADIFNSQYMLDPTNQEDAVFKINNINYYTDDQDKCIIYTENEKGELIPVKFAEIYILTDLAISQSDRADYTVINILGITNTKKVYEIDYIREKLNPFQIVQKIFEQYSKAKKYGYVKVVGIEKVAFQKVMSYLVKDEAKRRGVSIPLRDLIADKDKTRRINGIVPIVEAGDFYMSPRHTELRDEMRDFPFGKHDDIIDTVAYITQIMRPGVYRGQSKLEYKYRPHVSKLTNY